MITKPSSLAQHFNERHPAYKELLEKVSSKKRGYEAKLLVACPRRKLESSVDVLPSTATNAVRALQ